MENKIQNIRFRNLIKEIVTFRKECAEKGISLNDTIKEYREKQLVDKNTKHLKIFK